jgi:hypothetical protein
MATSTLGSGTLVLAGTTSGTTTVTATAIAGTTTLTLPAATDTLVGKATTDTLTNKTLTGAAMNGTVGATTPSTGAFTTVSATGSVTGSTLTSTRSSGSQPEVVLQQTSVATWSIYNPPSSADLRFYNGSDLLTLNSTGLKTKTTISVGDATPSSSGAGITFPATDSPSSNANTLDDYEEGTWTPNQGSGLTLVGAFSSSGTYTKIGRMVFVTGQFNGVTSVAIPATDIICTNLPFTTAVKSLGALNTGTIVQPGTVTLFSGTSIYGSTTSAASYIYFSILYSI